MRAAETGNVVEGLSGADRAMLYILAAWTGYRRKELSSLTDASFDLDGTPPVVSIHARNSKRRKRDCVPLHEEVAKRFVSWRSQKEIAKGACLFTLSTPAGYPRKTAKMMKRDLAVARARWVDEGETDQEKERRSDSNFLTYQDADGAFADFHSNRHTFVTNLALSATNPKIAQSLARHSDVNLTMNVYSHVQMEQKAAAVGRLAAPPSLEVRCESDSLALRLAQDSVSGGHGSLHEHCEARQLSHLIR
ncbi:Tn916 family transposase [Rosistilla carotiformis]|uniref:Tn916 family transposase n=1 Tax=Rosistilla carotiformis TaxID=2528017 RepID=A0A518K1Q6_9BACT|nr:Tn916 family transposase [Rosistilla carotiformis]